MTTTSLKIGIAGRKDKTANYERACLDAGLIPQVGLSISKLCTCDGLLLPGGGDITPCFYGQENRGSRSIDTELDILQLQALDFFVHSKKPILGICKGIQIINIYFGGTLIQHLANTKTHQQPEGDILHPSYVSCDCILSRLYGNEFVVNSNHHQAVDKLGKGLSVVQTAEDGVVEAVAHQNYPILGVQWHPERFEVTTNAHTQEKATLPGSLLLRSFFSNALT